MANEITIQALLSYQKYSPPLLSSGSQDVTQVSTTAKVGAASIQSIGISAEALLLGEVKTGDTASEGFFYLFVKNLGPTNYVELSQDNFTKIFAKLRVNEFCLLPLSQAYGAAAVVFAKANTAAVDVSIVACSP